ncbi:MAG: hypothetical protein WCG99_01935 [Candidatus Berkelbacteria bacterium]
MSIQRFFCPFPAQQIAFVHEQVEIALNDVLVLIDDPSRSGVYWSLSSGTGRIYSVMMAGEPPDEKVLRYNGFAVEKPTRLGQHPEHLTSDESADPDPEAGKFGGAFRLHWPPITEEDHEKNMRDRAQAIIGEAQSSVFTDRPVIMAVSGLSLAHHDSAVGMLALKRLGVITEDDIGTLIRRTGNDFWPIVYDEYTTIMDHPELFRR